MILIQPVDCPPVHRQRRRHQRLATLTVGLLSAVGLYAIAIVSLLAAQGIVTL
ncbi:MAG: hypothetical protein ACTSX7_14815 [Alphaproteobacteria bacterium]